MRVRWRGVGAVAIFYVFFACMVLAAFYRKVGDFALGSGLVVITVWLYKYGFWKDGVDK